MRTLYSLGEGSTFHFQTIPGIKWVVTKHDYSKVEIMADAYGQALYAVAGKEVAERVPVEPQKIWEPTNHVQVGETLSTMKNSPDYLPLESLPPGTRATAYFSSIQSFKTIEVDKHQGPTTRVVIYDDTGAREGVDVILSTKEVLKIR